MPDVEVIFDFIGVRRFPTCSGYRADHEITESYLTCGEHQYEGSSTAPLCGQIRGTISFIAPEHYPHTCRIGKVIPIQEGARLVGYATVERVLNPLLDISTPDQ